MKTDITRLIKISDFLDANGRDDDADFIDKLIYKGAEEFQGSEFEVEVSQDDMDMLMQIFNSLKLSLPQNADDSD